MATVEDLREGMRAKLATIKGCQVSAYVLSNFTPPCFYIEPDKEEGVAYDTTMGRGTDTWMFRVVGIVGAASDIGSQKRLDRWVDSAGDESVKAILETRPRTLGGVCDYVRVVSCDGYGPYRFEGISADVLSAVWHVQILASGTTT